MAQNMCVYSYVFETSILSDIRGQKKKIDAPRPFIIEPPLDQINYYGMDDRLVFHFILIGRAVDYIKICIKAFQERGDMGIGINNGKYFLENVTSINKDIERIIFDGNSYRDDCQTIESSELLNEGNKLNSNRVTLRFLTRARIKYEGDPVTDLDFEIFMVNLLGRLESIAWVHCDEKWEFDKIGLVKRSNQWELYDMVGNVWEWVQDTWHDSYKIAPKDNRPWEVGDGSHRTVRGGCWDTITENCRSAARTEYHAGTREHTIGFRLMKVL